MMWLQLICFSDVMSASEWQWVCFVLVLFWFLFCFFFFPLSYVVPAWILCVSLFHLVFCFLDFHRTFVPCLYFFLSGFPCCFLFLQLGFALLFFFISSRDTVSWTCEGSRVSCRVQNVLAPILGASFLPHSENIVICSHIYHHPLPKHPGGLTELVGTMPKRSLPRAK